MRPAMGELQTSGDLKQLADMIESAKREALRKLEQLEKRIENIERAIASRPK
jgi:hypothetical protein